MMDNDSLNLAGLDETDDENDEKDDIAREIEKCKNILIVEAGKDNPEIFEIALNEVAMSGYLQTLPKYYDVLKSYLNTHVNNI